MVCGSSDPTAPVAGFVVANPVEVVRVVDAAGGRRPFGPVVRSAGALRWDCRRLTQVEAPVGYVSRPVRGRSPRQGRLIGQMEALGFHLQQEALLHTLTADVQKSSEIEGEKLDTEQVRSSIARRLGMDAGALRPVDRHVEGIVEMMMDAARHYKRPLTPERLFAWHASLFPTGRSGMTMVATGAWRDGGTGPMQVVSGPVRKERVHFEAPKADRADAETHAFLDWFETPLIRISC